MWRWLSGLSRGNYENEHIAGSYHAAHAVMYGFLIGGYVALIMFHLAAAGRHFRAAREAGFVDSARRAESRGEDADSAGC